jgi:hypothetical protein
LIDVPIFLKMMKGTATAQHTSATSDPHPNTIANSAEILSDCYDWRCISGLSSMKRSSSTEVIHYINYIDQFTENSGADNADQAKSAPSRRGSAMHIFF